jgi:hypothetical protein
MHAFPVNRGVVLKLKVPGRNGMQYYAEKMGTDHHTRLFLLLDDSFTLPDADLNDEHIATGTYFTRLKPPLLTNELRGAS